MPNATENLVRPILSPLTLAIPGVIIRQRLEKSLNSNNGKQIGQENTAQLLSLEWSQFVQCIIILWPKWPMVKRSILIGFLSGLHFAKWTAKMDRSGTDFNDSCF